MATQYIDKKHQGTLTSPSEITDTADNRKLVQSKPDAAGLAYDRASGFLKYNGADAIKTVVSVDGTQTLTNKTLTSPVITGATLTAPLFSVTEYDADGAIAIATGIVALISADAGAYTLAAPTAGQAGTLLIITSKTAAAHVITATNLINDGVGPTLDTITFDAQPGASIQLVAYNLLWYVVSQNGTTATAGA